MTRRGKSRAKSSPTKPRRVNKLTLQKQTALKAFRTILSDSEFTETQGVLQNLLSSKETPKGEKENTHATPETPFQAIAVSSQWEWQTCSLRLPQCKPAID